MNKLLKEKIDLAPKDLAEVCRILSVQIPALTVWAFGSRVCGTARKYSDLDLALITSEPLSLSDKADLVTCFENSDLPFKVDLLDWASTSENFRNIILANKILIQEGRGYQGD